MSYSFSVNATSRGALLAAVSVKFDEVVAQQPMHAHDREHVCSMVSKQLDFLTDLAPGKSYYASVNGYLSWQNPPPDVDQSQVEFTAFSAGVSVAIGDTQ